MRCITRCDARPVSFFLRVRHSWQQPSRKPHRGDPSGQASGVLDRGRAWVVVEFYATPMPTSGLCRVRRIPSRHAGDLLSGRGENDMQVSDLKRGRVLTMDNVAEVHEGMLRRNRQQNHCHRSLSIVKTPPPAIERSCAGETNLVPLWLWQPPSAPDVPRPRSVERFDFLRGFEHE